MKEGYEAGYRIYSEDRKRIRMVINVRTHEVFDGDTGKYLWLDYSEESDLRTYEYPCYRDYAEPCEVPVSPAPDYEPWMGAEERKRWREEREEEERREEERRAREEDSDEPPPWLDEFEYIDWVHTH